MAAYPPGISGSVLGLYPTCPGKPVYDLGIPLFKHLRLFLPQEKKMAAYP